MAHWSEHRANWEFETLVHRAIRDTQTPEQPKPNPDLPPQRNPDLPPEPTVQPGVLPPIEPRPEPQNPMPAPQPPMPNIQGTPRLRQIREMYQPAVLPIIPKFSRLHSPRRGRSLV